MRHRTLVQKGASIGSTNWANDTPLHFVSMKGSLSVVEFLLEEGAALEVKTRRGFTPLHLASRNGHKPVVEFLLGRGANMNAICSDGKTPLRLAVDGGEVEIAVLLQNAMFPPLMPAVVEPAVVRPAVVEPAVVEPAPVKSSVDGDAVPLSPSITAAVDKDEPGTAPRCCVCLDGPKNSVCVPCGPLVVDTTLCA